MRVPALLLLWMPLSSLLADQVTFKNGDRITGSVVSKDAKTLTIKTAVFGLVTVPWTEVETLRTDQPVTVELSSGKTVQGTLTAREQKVEIAQPGTRQWYISAQSGPQPVSAETAQAIRGGLGYSYNLSPRLFLNGSERL